MITKQPTKIQVIDVEPLGMPFIISPWNKTKLIPITDTLPF